MPRALSSLEVSEPTTVDYGPTGRSASIDGDRVSSGLPATASVGELEASLRSLRFLHSGASFLARLDDETTPVPSTATVLDMIAGSTLGSVGAGQTLYLGLFEDADVADVSLPVPAGTAAQVFVESTAAPGSGESFAFTIIKNGSATSMAVTVSDTSTAGTTTANPVGCANGDRLALRLVTSAGAASAKHRYSIRYSISA
jgi:hypothetical protein